MAQFLNIFLPLLHFFFFFQAPDLLFPHKKGKAVSKSEKKIVAHLLSRTPISPFLLPLGILLVCYTMGRHCKGSLTDLKIKVFVFLYLPTPQPTPKKYGWMKQYVRRNIPLSSVRR